MFFEIQNLKFPNLKFNLSWIIAYILIWNVNFDEKCEPFVVIKKSMRPFWDKWNQLNKITCLKKLKLHQISSKTVYEIIHIKLY